MRRLVHKIIGGLVCLQSFFFFNSSHVVDVMAQNRWGLGVSTSVISDADPMGPLYGQFGIPDGDAGGQIYLFNADYRLSSFDFTLNSTAYRINMEIVSTIGVVDENARDPFFNLNCAFALRWMDFPWNRHLATTIMSGLGLNYSEKIFMYDELKHPGEHRSHLKFFWPLEISFALPSYENHRLVLFNHHISGGWIFDEGGMESLGIGYRYLFD